MAFQRLLVIANKTVAGETLHEHIRELTEGGGEVIVVAPALGSRMKYIFSDIDGPRAQARERVDTSVDLLGADGIDASGHVGDMDPVRAFEDSVAMFRPDAVLVATHPHGREHWKEVHEVERIRRRTDLPVEQVVIDLPAAEAESRLSMH